jgi:hypothetical protein
MAGLLTPIDPDSIGLMDNLPALQYQPQQPGLLSRISGALSGALTNNPLLDMGLGIMASAGQLGGGVGAGAMQGAQLYRQQQQGALQQQLGRQQLASSGLNAALMAPWLRSAGLLTPQVKGLLDQITGQQSQPSTGLQSASQLPTSAPAAPSTLAATDAPAAPNAAPASMSGPQPSNGLPDPWNLMQQGTFFASSPVPMFQERGKAMIQAANTIFANDPRYVTPRAQAASALAQDQYAIQQAQASGDPLALQAARMKYLTDSKLVNVGQYNGTVTTLGGLTPEQVGASSVSPQRGTQVINGVESPLAGAPQTTQALAAAQAQGEAAGKTINLVDPSSGATTPVPLDQYLQFMRQFTPAQAAAGQTPISALGPSQEHQLAATGQESGKYISDLQTQADNARQANYTLDQMSTVARGVVLGPAAPAKAWMQNAATAMAQLFGANPPAQALGNYQELTKYANQVAFAATRQMGSREAAQIVHLQMESNPNPRLMPQAFADLVGSMRAMNSYIVAKNTAIQGVATDKASALKAASTWTNQVDPRVWDLSLSPQMATKFAPQIGFKGIATAIPFMANEDAISVMRNLPASMRTQVLRGLPDSVAQQILTGLQQSSGATGAF